MHSGRGFSSAASFNSIYKYSTPSPWSSPFANSCSVRLKLERCFGECIFSEPINLYCVIYNVTAFSVLKKATNKPKEIGKSLMSTSEERIKNWIRRFAETFGDCKWSRNLCHHYLSSRSFLTCLITLNLSHFIDCTRKEIENSIPVWTSVKFYHYSNLNARTPNWYTLY